MPGIFSDLKSSGHQLVNIIIFLGQKLVLTAFGDMKMNDCHATINAHTFIKTFYLLMKMVTMVLGFLDIY